jgi:hypothetical protein
MATAPQVYRQGHCGRKLFVSDPKVRGLEQHRVHLLLETVPRLFVGRDLHVRKMLGHCGFPRGQFLIAALETQAHREAHGPKVNKQWIWIVMDAKTRQATVGKDS